MMGLGYDIPALAMRRAGALDPVPFSPISLSPSVFFDPSQVNTLFRDDAAALAVSADNQPVGLWQDLSGNGHDLTQAVSAARPTYRTDGTFDWVEMDGVDDGMATAPVFDVKNPVTMVFGYQMLSTTGTARVNIAEISKNSTNGISAGARPNIDRLQYYSRMSDQGVPASNLAAPTTWGGHDRHVVTLQAADGTLVMRMDGQTVIDAPQMLSQQMVAAQPLRIGLGVVTGSIPGAFRLYGLLTWTSSEAYPDPGQIDQLESWMAARTGVAI